MPTRRRGASGSLPELDPIPGTGSSKRVDGYPATVPSWARPISRTELVSRGNSPSPSPTEQVAPDLNGEILALSAGCQPDHVYAETLPAWRYTIRKHLVRSLDVESPILGKWQKKTRAPFWDSYFIWSSIFGTHSAFMVGLPIFWWFGYTTQGLGLVNILAAGVYISSFIKDLLCVPRPYTPPVHRLSISSHGLEYGFPSTHSTNAVSISLYCAEIFLRGYPEQKDRILQVAVLVLCAVYAVSVVLGRLYCGMHSMVDCMAGTLLGALIWYINLLVTPSLLAFLAKQDSIVPSLIVPLCLFLVSVHPEPVDDCPCFEDAIAFIAVSAGICIGHWSVSSAPLAVVHTLGSLPSFSSSFDQQTAQGAAVWVMCVAVKLVIGVASLFLWRLMAKRVLYTILPPLFKLFQPIISLPRKHYETASGYQEIEDSKPMQAIPSLLDLTQLGSPSAERSNPFLAPPSSADSSRAPSPVQGDSANASREDGFLNVVGTASRRPRSSEEGKQSRSSSRNGTSKQKPKVRQLRQVHYDVDVLTKVGVYSGIGYIATITMPWLFRQIGLDV